MAAHRRAAHLGGALAAAGVVFLAVYLVIIGTRTRTALPPAVQTQQVDLWREQRGAGRLLTLWARPGRTEDPRPASSGVVEGPVPVLEATVKGLGLPPAVGVLVVREAWRQGLDPGLVAGVVALESGFDPELTQRNSDGTYDRGLMQLNDSTSPWLAERAGIRPFDLTRDPYDPEKNLRMGCWYLAFLLQRYGGDHDLALLAYNAGIGTADRRRAAAADPGSAYTRAVQRAAVRLGYRGWVRPAPDRTGGGTPAADG